MAEISIETSTTVVVWRAHQSRGKQSSIHESPLSLQPTVTAYVHRFVAGPRRSRSDPRTRESKLARNRPPWSYSVVVTRSSFPSIRFDRLPKKRGEGRKKEKEKEGKKMLLSCFSLLSALGYRHSLGRVYPLPLFNQNAVVFQLEGIRRVQAIT